MKKFSTATLAKVAILGAIGAILMFIRFPLPFAPPFMDIDVSEVPGLIGGFALGPIQGVIIVLIKIVLKLITQGTSTFFVGELSNFIVSSTFIVVATMIYRRKKTRTNAFMAMIVSTVAMSIIATVSNYIVIFPLYGMAPGSQAMNGLIKAIAVANPLVKDTSSFFLFSIVPFNVVKGLLTSLVTLLLYKPISPIIKRDHF